MWQLVSSHSELSCGNWCPATRNCRVAVGVQPFGIVVWQLVSSHSELSCGNWCPAIHVAIGMETFGEVSRPSRPANSSCSFTVWLRVLQVCLVSVISSFSFGAYPLSVHQSVALDVPFNSVTAWALSLCPSDSVRTNTHILCAPETQSTHRHTVIPAIHVAIGMETFREVSRPSRPANSVRTNTHILCAPVGGFRCSIIGITV